MWRLFVNVLVVLPAGALLTGCGLGSISDWAPFDESSKPVSHARPSPPETRRSRRRDPTRTVARNWAGVSERACLASGAVRETRFVVARSSLGGPMFGPAIKRGCGAYRPFEVTALDYGRIRLTKTATLRCPMIPALDRWTRDVLAPAAMRYLGSPVRRVRVVASYDCRRIINGRSNNRLSEHGRANAIDIAAFELADGRVVTVKRGWRGPRAEALFLRRVHRGACDHFTTVLGPRANRFHHDHFHFDLARHGRTGTYRVCR